MGKQKVYELAKEMGLDNKTLIEKLNEIGIEVSSHLSSLSDEDIKKAKKNISVTAKINTKKEKELIENGTKENHVIIRREIQVVQENKKETKKEESKKEDIGFVKRKNENQYNLINRNRQKTQVSSIADLFKKETKKEEIVEKPEGNIVEKVQEKHEDTNKNVEKRENRFNTNRNNNNFNKAKPEYKKDNNNGNNNNYKKNNTYSNNNGYKGNNSYKNNNENNNFRPNKIEKEIKNIMTSPASTEKEITKDSTKFNKTIKTQNDDNKKQNVKGKTNSADINMGKLKDLKTQKSLSTMFEDSEGGMLDYYDLSNNRKSNKRNKKGRETNNIRREYEKNKIFELTKIMIPEYITVKDLAELMKKTTGEVIKKLLGLGIMATINQELDFDTAFLLSNEFGITAEKQVVISDEEILFDETDDKEENLQSRPPVVVVMGHVDHGKTSLLDAIRSTNVIDKEAGGITQHIGAYKVKINNREITFLDTPGHEAFTSMRARGAQVTDIAILIVAADDGIMPQTIEAINHAKAANVPIIVAINKIDKEGANIEKVKQGLAEYDLVPEEWGGDTICVPISAKQKIGIDNLLEMVLLVADMKNLRADPNKQSKGTVIEARLDKNKGVIATVLVQRGTLNIGDTIVVGSTIGKVRVLIDDKGKKVKLAGPSTPVEIIGLHETPEGGELFYEVENEKVAKHLIEKRKIKQREQELKQNSRVTLDDLFSQIEEGKIKDLNLIIKADVQGSVEAVKQAMLKLSNDKVRVKVIHANVGAISVSDVTLAKVANAIIIGFNVRPDNNAKDMSENDKVDIKLYSVIYKAIEDVQKAMKGLLDPTYEENILGMAEVRNVFKVSNIGTIAGSYVTNGKIVRNGLARVIRDGVTIYQGKIVSLKRFKDDVKEAATNYECGIQIENYNDIKELDQIECYVMQEIKE